MDPKLRFEAHINNTYRLEILCKIRYYLSVPYRDTELLRSVIALNTQQHDAGTPTTPISDLKSAFAFNFKFKKYLLHQQKEQGMTIIPYL